MPKVSKEHGHIVQFIPSPSMLAAINQARTIRAPGYEATGSDPEDLVIPMAVWVRSVVAAHLRGLGLTFDGAIAPPIGKKVSDPAPARDLPQFLR
jgi:hypothetical protein